MEFVTIDGAFFGWEAVPRLGGPLSLLVGDNLLVVDSGDHETNREHAEGVLRAIVDARARDEL